MASTNTFFYYLLSSIYFDNRDKKYKKILTINEKPQGDLSNYVKQINPPKLSPFKTSDRCNNCIWAILCFENKNEFLTIDRLPELIIFLKKKGYNIDVETTNLLKTNTESNDSKIIAFIQITQ